MREPPVAGVVAGAAGCGWVALGAGNAGNAGKAGGVGAATAVGAGVVTGAGWATGGTATDCCKSCERSLFTPYCVRICG